MLDDARNDIYIHMDKKCASYDPQVVKASVSVSNVYHIKRRNVAWGGRSMMDVEIALLSESIKRGRYRYYHLLSGQDLPIKSQGYIHDFFDRNQGKEFVRFQAPDFKFDYRIRQYHFFQERLGRRWFESKWNMFLLKKQEKLGIHRHVSVSFQKGTQWVSITDSLARYIVSKEKWLKRVFRYSLCCDELFVQTLMLNTPYMDSLYHQHMDNDIHAIMRLIDWKRGTPYVFRNEDFEELASSDMLFARKFDSTIDSSIIGRIRELVTSGR